MAGFETIVRPMIFPNIRPAPQPAVVPVETDPNKGLCVIQGQSAKTIKLPYSYVTQWAELRSSETSRRVDVVRVYQQEPQQGQQGQTFRSGNAREEGDGINRENYIDVEVANLITMQEGSGEKDYAYARAKASANIEILKRNVIKRA